MEDVYGMRDFILVSHPHQSTPLSGEMIGVSKINKNKK
jgi:hypothetical protein